MLDGVVGPCETDAMRAPALSLAFVLPLAACDAPVQAPVSTPAPTAAVPAPPVAADRLVRAEQAARALQDRLKDALTAAITQGGPIAAIDVCATMAPSIAKSLSVDGLTVGRTALRLRNPNNVTPVWLGQPLERWAKAPAAERQPLHETLEDGRFVYAAPITTRGVCLTCHGANVADDVKSAIAGRYPKDAAIGFAEGDLRGAVWVELKN
jgi:hypothetical protein